MSTEFVSLNEVFLPVTGGDIEGSLDVNGLLTVNDKSGNGTVYDVADEIAELKSELDSVSQNKVLWSGVLHMGAGEVAELSEPASSQTSGIVLVWSFYNPNTNEAKDYNWNFTFVPKWHAAKNLSQGVDCVVKHGSFIASKYVHVKDASIIGHANNNNSAYTIFTTAVDMRYWVLRYVIGV